MFDVIIKGGDVIDGTGAARRQADVGITGDRITTIARLGDAEARSVIDATGKAVTPGFVDVHTHLDAQVFWDTTLSPSPLHGVTTVIGGNCGFTIAPLSDDPADGDYLMKMLSRVEGMPLEALQQGVPWNWKTTEEYLASFENTLSINAGFKVGHSALRRVVMGDNAVKRPCTPDELAAMQDLLRAGLDAGGLGFSSSWARTHNDPFGNMVPSRYAEREELVALCSVLADYEGTSVEFIPMIGPFAPEAMELMADMSAAAQSPLNWNVMNVNRRTLEEGKQKLEAGDIAASKGGKVVALTVPMTLALHLNFVSGFILDALPDWEHFCMLPTDEKRAILSDPAGRAALNDSAQADGPMKSVAHWGAKTILHSNVDGHQDYIGKTVYEVADHVGNDPWNTLVDLALEDNLELSFGNPPPDEPDTDWEARMEIWRDPRAVVGASDAGAHLDLFLSSNYATHMLGQAVRRRGLMEMEEGVQLLTSVQADLYGLKDRGRLQEGAYADVVVLDEGSIDANPLSVRDDLPAGASRLYSDAVGIDHVICNGAEIVRGGEFTEARPGTVLRSGQHTRNPDLS
jgi:N-acyl-D-aspartate/D-glutamate deacylase